MHLDRTDPITEFVAKKIFEIAQTGERDPVVMRQLTLKALGSATLDKGARRER